jgi:hypothetical protein
MFHRPAAFASAFSSSRIGGMRHCRQSSVCASWFQYVGSLGTTRSRTKRSTASM